MASYTHPDFGCISDAQFEVIRVKFVTLADRLNDEQMLKLADTYHEQLRQRRAIRVRHPRVTRPASVPHHPS